MVLRKLCAGEVTKTGSRHKETNAWDYGQVRIWTEHYVHHERNLQSCESARKYFRCIKLKGFFFIIWQEILHKVKLLYVGRQLTTNYLHPLYTHRAFVENIYDIWIPVSVILYYLQTQAWRSVLWQDNISGAKSHNQRFLSQRCKKGPTGRISYSDR